MWRAPVGANNLALAILLILRMQNRVRGWLGGWLVGLCAVTVLWLHVIGSGIGRFFHLSICFGNYFAKIQSSLLLVAVGGLAGICVAWRCYDFTCHASHSPSPVQPLQTTDGNSSLTPGKWEKLSVLTVWTRFDKPHLNFISATLDSHYLRPGVTNDAAASLSFQL